MAVKIVIKRKFKDGNMRVASRLLINNRNEAMKHSGYISSENWRSLDDTNQVVVVSMWDTMEAWKTWTNSEICKANVAELKDHLIGEAEYEHYSLGLALE